MIEADQIRRLGKRPVRRFEIGCSPRDGQNGTGVVASNDRAKSHNAIEVIFEHQEEIHLSPIFSVLVLSIAVLVLASGSILG